MKVIVCIDDRRGMSFNNRRQSKDEILRNRIMDIVGKRVLWMNQYTLRQFVGVAADDDKPQLPISIGVAPDFLDWCGDEDYCFVELDALADYKDKIDTLIVYKWNREYPYDKQLDLDLNDFELVKEEIFEGKSHPEITECVYKKKTA